MYPAGQPQLKPRRLEGAGRQPKLQEDWGQPALCTQMDSDTSYW